PSPNDRLTVSATRSRIDRSAARSLGCSTNTVGSARATTRGSVAHLTAVLVGAWTPADAERGQAQGGDGRAAATMRVGSLVRSLAMAVAACLRSCLRRAELTPDWRGSPARAPAVAARKWRAARR